MCENRIPRARGPEQGAPARTRDEGAEESPIVMPNLRIDQLKVGMVVSEDVFVDRGRKIISRGSILNEKHLKSFKSWGIDAIPIGKGDCAEPVQERPEDVDPGQWKVIQEQVEALFSRSNTDSSLVVEMMRLCGIHKYKRDKGVNPQQ